MDIVVNAATSDDLELTKSINRGLAKGRLNSRKKGVLVHISGTQLIESKPTGRLEEVPKYDDLHVEQIKSIPDSALHRLIDLEYVHWFQLVRAALTWTGDLSTVTHGICTRG